MFGREKIRFSTYKMKLMQSTFIADFLKCYNIDKKKFQLCKILTDYIGLKYMITRERNSEILSLVVRDKRITFVNDGIIFPIWKTENDLHSDHFTLNKIYIFINMVRF